MRKRMERERGRKRKKRWKQIRRKIQNPLLRVVQRINVAQMVTRRTSMDHRLILRKRTRMRKKRTIMMTIRTTLNRPPNKRKEIKEKSALPKQNLVQTRTALRLMGIKEGTRTRKIRVMGTIATESRVVPLGCLLKDRRFTGVQHPGGVKVIPFQTNGFTYS